MKTFFSFLLLSVCFSITNAQLVFTNNANNAILNLDLASKQEIVVQLTQNGGTAYNWKLVQNNEAVCKFEKEDTKAVEPTMPGMVGTPVIRQFYFKSTGKAGTSTMKMQLVSFSGEIAETFTFTVKSPYPAKKGKRK